MKNFYRIIKVAAVLFGLLLILGAVGNGDFYGYLTASDYVHIALGSALIGAVLIGKLVARWSTL